ncbi:hypothetical protein ACIBH1_37005 [Nonomuraea sp. NPDC050663]|uniref:hypothetical protein n=1 Tax=Nonomuraea sp. NPDC050663 TaxID=3364370 RepID=UPI0037AA9483
MTRRMVRLEMDVLVVNGLISLLDDGGVQVVPDLDDRRQWLFTGDNAVIVASAGHTDHYAALTLEVWPSAPPAPPADRAWEVVEERVVRLSSGDLEVHPLVTPPGTQILRVGPRGAYHLRAHACGRAEIAALTPDPDIHALRGTERLLLQFWPSRHQPS